MLRRNQICFLLWLFIANATCGASFSLAGSRVEVLELELCKGQPPVVDASQFRYLRDVLSSGVSEIESLRSFDKAITSDCIVSGSSDGKDLLASVLRLLALNWKQKGNYARADKVYEMAYEHLQPNVASHLEKIAVLQGWADLKVLTNEPLQASEFARQQVEVARMGVESKQLATIVLVNCLSFQAAILDRLSRGADAEKVRQEAERIVVEPCKGICGETIQKSK